MSNTNIGRRSFTGLALVAAGGLVAGSRIVNAQEKDKKVDLGVDPNLLLSEPHTCKGLNTCKGECAVPLKAETAKLARMQFEQLMKASGKKVGPSPK